MADDLVERLQGVAGISDHERGCQGREYSCSCGYDDLVENLCDRAQVTIRNQSARITALEASLAEAEGRVIAARRQAFEEAAKVADGLGGGRIERNPDGSLLTYDMNCKHDRGDAVLNAMRVRAQTIAQAIRSLKDRQGNLGSIIQD